MGLGVLLSGGALAQVNLTVKSRDRLKQEGAALVETVERWNSFARVKNDLFGIVDVLAVAGGETLAVQVTSRDNMASRRKKIRESEAFPELVKAGWRVELHGWYKEKNRWKVKLEVLSENTGD
jgi:hypothetical protein